MTILWAATLALPLSGCAASRFETPDLKVGNVEMQKGDLFEQRFKVDLRVLNPNDRALPVKGITAKIDLNGEEFAQAVGSDGYGQITSSFG